MGSMPRAKIDVPVLIIGTGPSGATTALHLGRLGIKSMAVSRYRGTANTPRAHIFNQRAMEVLRDAGLEERLKSTSSPAHEMQHTSWSHSLAGEDVLEPVLVTEAEKFGAEFRFATEFVRFTETAGGVQTTLRDRNNDEEYQVSSRYLIGADGARSAVLTALGVPIVGRQLNTAFNVHIKADLSKYLVNRPGSLNWILNPDAPDWSAVGNFRMVRPWNEFVVSMHPAAKDPSTFQPSDDMIRKRLYQMIGEDNVPIEILSAFSWTINDQVAERWQQGRVLCVGDATHRHPPINGLGSNTCLSDAFNLAWKLAFVLRGQASPKLLETLTLERKPVGDGVVRRANEGMEAHRRLWALLGLTQEARKKAVELAQSATEEGAEFRREWCEALEATDDEVQALGIQMNQIYLDSLATVVEPGDQPPDFSHLNPLKEVMISTYPGYHLPHVWLAASGQSPRVSVLDLSGHGCFSLFTGIGGEDWVSAANTLSTRSGVIIKGYSIGFRCDYIDCYRDWIRVRGVGETGVVLVRPDHFVAWRCKELVSDPVETLSRVIGQILDQKLSS